MLFKFDACPLISDFSQRIIKDPEARSRVVICHHLSLFHCTTFCITWYHLSSDISCHLSLSANILFSIDMHQNSVWNWHCTIFESLIFLGRMWRRPMMAWARRRMFSDWSHYVYCLFLRRFLRAMQGFFCIISDILQADQAMARCWKMWLKGAWPNRNPTESFQFMFVLTMSSPNYWEACSQRCMGLKSWNHKLWLTRLEWLKSGWWLTLTTLNLRQNGPQRHWDVLLKNRLLDSLQLNKYAVGQPSAALTLSFNQWAVGHLALEWCHQRTLKKRFERRVIMHKRLASNLAEKSLFELDVDLTKSLCTKAKVEPCKHCQRLLSICLYCLCWFSRPQAIFVFCHLSPVAKVKPWKLLPTPHLSLLVVSMFLRMSCQFMWATCIGCQGWALKLLSAPLSQSLSMYWHDDGGYENDDGNDDDDDDDGDDDYDGYSYGDDDDYDDYDDDDYDDDYDDDGDDDDDDDVVGGGVIFIVRVCPANLLRLKPSPIHAADIRLSARASCGLQWCCRWRWFAMIAAFESSHAMMWLSFLQISSGSKKVMARHANSSGHAAIIMIRRITLLKTLKSSINCIKLCQSMARLLEMAMESERERGREREREKNVNHWKLSCHLSHATCHTKSFHVTCHMPPVILKASMSPVTCHMPPVICHLSPLRSHVGGVGLYGHGSRRGVQLEMPEPS